MNSDQLKKLLEDYQQNKPIPEVSEEEFQDTKRKLEAIQQPFTQQPPQIESSNLPVESPLVQQDIPQIKEQVKVNPFQDNELDQAMKTRDLLSAFTGLSKAGALIGGAIAGVKPNLEVYGDLEKQAERPVEDIKLKRQQQNVLMDMSVKRQQDDPNSSVSKQARSLAKSFGLQIPEDASYNAVKPLMEDAQKYAQFKENVEMRKELGKLRAAELQTTREAKQEVKDTQRFDQMSKLVESNVSSSRSAFGQAARNMQTIQAAKALLSGSVNLDDIDNREIQEVARTLDRILSGGSPTITGTTKLTPETARSKAAKMMEFVTSQRQGAGLGEFVKRYQKTLDREESIAKKQISETQKSLLSSYKDLQQKYPERFNEVLQLKGIPTDVLDVEKDKKQEEQKQSLLKQFNSIKQPSISSEDEEAIKWAKDNKSDPRAQRILKLHGLE